MARNPGEGVAACAETPTPQVWHFAVILPRLLFSLLFLVVSFQNSLTLEEPEVLKVGLYISACRVGVDRLTPLKPTLGCSGKAEG